MICKSCNTENQDGAAFCKNCGQPLAADKIAEEVEKKADQVMAAFKEAEASAPVPEDTDDERTTILSVDTLNNLPNPEEVAAPQKFAPAPEQPVAPEAAPAQQAPQAAPAQQAPQAAPVQQAPQAAPVQQAPQAAPMHQAPQMAPMAAPMPQAPQGKTTKVKPEKAPKQPKQPKQAKEKAPKGKTKTGVIVYIVISIILILGLAGVGVWGYLTYEKKLDDKKKEIKNLEADYSAQVDNYEAEIDEKDAEIADLAVQVDSLTADVKSLEDTVSSYENENNYYAQYDALIDYVGSVSGQGYADFFVSDTVIHLTGGTVAVKIFAAADDAQIKYHVDNSSVATCEFDENWENNVATMYISPENEGNTTITLTEETSGESVTIYVYVD